MKIEEFNLKVIKSRRNGVSLDEYKSILLQFLVLLKLQKIEKSTT